MSRARRLLLAAALIGLAACACAGASALAAGPAAASAAVPTVYLKVGDQLLVRGAPLACVVQDSRGVINVVCVKGSPSSPAPGGYGVFIADRAATLDAVSTQSARILKEVAQPAVSGATFAVRPGRPRALTIAPPAAVLVGATHIFCAVEKAHGALPVNVTCGLSSLAAKLQYPPGTYITSESSRFALLGKVEPKRQFKTIFTRAQP